MGMAERLPLEGIRVLDISTFIAAPAAAVVLGDFGADVIKVEQPGEGDPNRAIVNIASYPKPSAPFEGVNYPWEMDSRNKRSIAIDLKHDAGRAALDKLIARADVLITNFPMPVRKRLRLLYDDVAPSNPRLIFCSFTGYGEAGPDRDQAGFDSTAYFARSGILDSLRYEGQPPHFALPAQGDRATAMSIVAGIMMALYDRERTGRGTQVSTSLLANGLWSNGVLAQAALLGGFLANRPPRETPRSALGNLYQTKDDRWILLALPVEEKMWPRLCRALDAGELLRDTRFALPDARRANSAVLTSILDDAFAQRDCAAWQMRLVEEGLVFGIVSRMQDLQEDAQAAACGAVVATANPRMPLTIGAPFQLNSHARKPAGPAPALGEHTTAILREAGFTNAEITELEASGALG